MNKFRITVFCCIWFAIESAATPDGKTTASCEYSSPGSELSAPLAASGEAGSALTRSPVSESQWAGVGVEDNVRLMKY
jgi:hypothetical protein